ncbi:hypothetical protein OF83DRAFT_1176493 [Amylostereum chailletii]|nr:hypothetical protein OF83DRAFT_1176493 [Amylostereum chailletii]
MAFGNILPALETANRRQCSQRPRDPHRAIIRKPCSRHRPRKPFINVHTTGRTRAVSFIASISVILAPLDLIPLDTRLTAQEPQTQHLKHTNPARLFLVQLHLSV